MEKLVNRMLMLFEAMGGVLNIILMLCTYAYALTMTEGTSTAAVVSAGLISLIFCCAINIVIGFIWAYVTKRHPDYMTQFFTAASGIRFLGMLAVMGACYIQVGREAMAPYALTLFLFYIINVGFHTVFFSHISNKLL